MGTPKTRSIHVNRPLRIEPLEDRIVLNGDTLYISELMAVNQSVLRDEDGDRSDWIELHNSSGQPLSLEGWALTDDADDLTKWRLPAVTLLPDEYYVVFASGKDRRDPSAQPHTNFRLAGSGEYLALVNPAGEISSELAPSFPVQHADVSYGMVDDGTYAYLSQPTPGQANSDKGQEYAAKVRVSADSGFYDAPLEVTLVSDTPDAVIRYTTDGSAPSMTSGQTYSGPLLIQETTVLRAAAFKPGLRSQNPTTRSYLFLDDVIRQDRQSALDRGFPASWGRRAADYAMDQRVIGQDGTDAYGGRYANTIREDLASIPSLSLVMDVNDLFGSQGIYSNPTRRGPQWERPTSAELIYPNGDQGFQIDAGIQVQGGVSREISPKLSFRLDMKDRYGAATLKYPLFGDDAADEFNSLVLRAGGGEALVGFHYIRDQYVRDSHLAMGSVSPHGRFVHLYVNGLYWGLYNVVERPDATFASNYFGGRPDQWDVLSTGDLTTEPIKAINGDLGSWSVLVALVRRLGRARTQE